ncbi:uncharacterized protein [Nicotiana tomentosiformis]|uniref:uncharacterized protein n=1 Tax=Nicotiana tomentosiformis TaxID=4098 RepID=UPI00388C52D6
MQRDLDAAVPWIPDTVSGLKNWVRDLISTSTYVERSWHNLSKGRWEANNHGLGKDAVLSDLSGEEEASAFVPKSVKDNKRKRASTSENPKPKTRTARKPRKNTIPLTEELVRRLRDEDEEEEDDGSVLVARVKKIIDAPTTAGSMVVCVPPPRIEAVSEKDSGKVPELMEVENASHRSQQPVGISERADPEVLRTEENVPSDSLGAIRETLEEIHTRGFDLTEDIKRAKELEANAEASASDDDDDDDERSCSEVVNTFANVDAFVAVYRDDAEAAQVQAREVGKTTKARAHWIVELAKCRSRRETLEEIHTRGFDLTEEIKRAKELEADAEASASDDDNDGDGSKSGSESKEEADGEETAPRDNQEI